MSGWICKQIKGTASMKKQFLAMGCALVFGVQMQAIERVAVFCSADDKVSAEYKRLAHDLGAQLGLHGLHLVTGGSNTGLMKEVVDGYVETGSEKNIFGVLPESLKPYDVHHPSIPSSNLSWVSTIHVRLARFHELVQAVIALPGGFGTLHELLDFMVHKQFGLIQMPIILVNPDGFWDGLVSQFNHMKEQKLLSQKTLDGLDVVKSVQQCIDVVALLDYGEKQGLQDRYWEQN